ncbi:hypothetical protein CANCADRAFT_128778 [Tortispora caseinolytica NRRL Y-17796]|uniref:3'(2'),5'-bisphosphate nucleotidase n=1 Tax=Tortispora caseinolytica NRRL Y-17796 TaxID=767744 RepID=A0A1E4TAU0_9ASCO|nr:hypothetical protein CANCADRAFT_128778 [Tortispora caseinolytica NRRL Y-17796]
MAYAVERKVAELAVIRACRLTNAVATSHKLGTLTKSDQSPVTVADLGAQAMINHAVRQCFPRDAIVAEEDAKALRSDADLAQRVWTLIQTCYSEETNAEESSTIGRLSSVSEMLDALDSGDSKGGPVGRIWALDPIDGTKGFIRGGQYAVCLALIDNAQVKVGVIGCPNLPVDPANPDGDKGILLSAVAGNGVYSVPFKPETGQVSADRVSVSMRDIASTAEASFCESVEAGHSSHDDNAKIAQILGITKPSVRMDSQAKYASIARGDGDIYLRLPVSDTYQEKIWDHAAGNVIVKEAGGDVTDIFGKQLDFGIGRTLQNNKGVIAARKSIMPEVLAAVAKVRL